MANRIEERLAHILKLLVEASQSEFYADMRRRYASTEQWKVEGPNIKRHAAVCWFAAKQAIGEDREELNKHLRENKDKMSPQQLTTYLAALQVIDKEVETQFEQQFLEEDNMAKKPVNDDLFDEEVEIESDELDEDEEYVRQERKLHDGVDDPMWDGDEYLGDPKDLEDDESFI